MRLNLDDGALTLTLEGMERIWSLRRTIRVPLSELGETRIGPPTWGFLDIRAPGTFLPWVLRAGTYYTRRGKEFWYARHGKDALTIELLRPKGYRRLVLTPPDASAWKQQLDEAAARPPRAATTHLRA